MGRPNRGTGSAGPKKPNPLKNNRDERKVKSAKKST